MTKAAISQNVDVVGIKGHHRPGKNNDDVTRLSFSDLKFQYFPRNPQRIFPSLNCLNINNSDLKEISREDLVGLEKLVCLDLAHNQLKSLPDDLFNNMPHLKYVWLDHNQIQLASSKLIEPLVDNQLILFCLTKKEFFDSTVNAGCRTIRELMEKIDKKCTQPTPPTSPPIPLTTPTAPTLPTPPMISTAVQCDATDCETFKGANEYRPLKRFTDFVIAVDSEEFPVHKIILALQSSVLAKTMETYKRMEICSSNAKAVGAFLDYLYVRKRPSTQNASEILKLATKYEVAELKAICEEIIVTSLDELDALKIFKLSWTCKSDKLKVASFKKLQKIHGVDITDDLVNDPERLRKTIEILVEARKQLDDLRSNCKKPRLN